MEYSNLLIQLLYQMAYIDGHFDEAEKSFISQVIEDHAADGESLIEGKMEIPREEKDRMTILYYLLFLIKIDGRIDEGERKFAHKFGMLLGFRVDMIEGMLNVMEDHLDEKLPDDKLISIVRQYLN